MVFASQSPYSGCKNVRYSRNDKPLAEYFSKFYSCHNQQSYDCYVPNETGVIYGGKFEIFTDRKKQYRFLLRTSNGEVIAASQAYENKAACLKGIKALQKNAPIAVIIDPEEAVKKAAKAAPAKRGAKAAAPSAEAKEKKPRTRKPKA
ncbi:MAG: YegP family protein [Dysgonamonadaceae bacterium]|nr:YegP family protein [Dysgonamonadaceae bacterium]